MSERLVSVVLPIYNQADHLEPVVTEHLAALRGLPLRTEVILVPNNCRDDSVAIARRLEAEHPEVIVEELEQGGWGRAVKAGLARAQGELLCYTNSARTSTEMLTLSILYASVHPDVVVKANRKIRDNAVRRLGSLLYNLEVRWLFDVPEWDINGTPKVFPRACAELLDLRRDDDLIDAEFVARCARAGYRVLEMPVLATERHGGESTTKLKSALRLYTGAYRLAREMGVR